MRRVQVGDHFLLSTTQWNLKYDGCSQPDKHIFPQKLSIGKSQRELQNCRKNKIIGENAYCSCDI